MNSDSAENFILNYLLFLILFQAKLQVENIKIAWHQIRCFRRPLEWVNRNLVLFFISSMFISAINKQKSVYFSKFVHYNQKANQFIIRLKDHFKNRQLNHRITKHFDCLRASMSVCFNCVRNTLINIRCWFDWKWWRIWDNDRVTLGIETTRVNHSMDWFIIGHWFESVLFLFQSDVIFAT